MNAFLSGSGSFQRNLSGSGSGSGSGAGIEVDPDAAKCSGSGSETLITINIWILSELSKNKLIFLCHYPFTIVVKNCIGNINIEMNKLSKYLDNYIIYVL